MAGFGKVDLQRSKRWRARYVNPEVPRKPDGNYNYIGAPQTFRTKREAREWLAATQTRIAQGTWKSPEQEKFEREKEAHQIHIKSQKFGTYADKWLEGRELTPATRFSYESYLENHLKPRWGAVPIWKISVSEVRHWAAEVAPSRPGARKKSIELFRTILNSAVDDELISANPCKTNILKTVRAATSPTVKAHRKREPRALSMEELRQVAENVPPYMKVMVLLSGMVGLRAGEVRTLRGGDLEEKGNHLFLHIREGVTGNGKRLSYGTPKTSKSLRRVPVPYVLKEDILERARIAGSGGLLFPGLKGQNSLIPLSTYANALARLDKKIGIGHVSPHDLRHTASSLMQMQGVSEQVVRDVLGHTTTIMTQRYTHTFDEQLARAAGALASLYNSNEPDSLE